MRRVSGALAAAWVLGGALLLVAPARTSAVSATGNIPGVPLPAPQVSGQLGGPIYDVVYSVDVPAARVLLVSLSGTPGTDFDLYLFDATATDIYAEPPVGLVDRSTGPTSTESLTYPTIGGGRFYVDVSSATNAEGMFQLSVQVATDTTPPHVTLSLDGGAPATNATAVTATVVATDDLSGVVDMQLSGDGANWSSWQPYTPTVPWIFPAGDGPKSLWVRVRDGAGNLSSLAKATIELITTAPVVVVREPDPASPVTGTLPTIRVTFSEPIRVSSWLNSGLLLQDFSGTVLYGTYGWDAATNTGSFTPASPLVAGAAYSVSLGSVVDEAGNPLVPIGTWVIRPMIVPVVTMSLSPRLTSVGSTVAVSGRVEGGLGAPVVIERALAGGPWVQFVTVFPTQDGSFTTGAAINANSSFRAAVAATSTSTEATSVPVRVLARRGVALIGIKPSVSHGVAAYARLSLTAKVTPSDPAVSVTLSIDRYTVGRGYVPQVALTRSTVGGRYTFSWRPAPGSYRVIVTTAPSLAYANGLSPTYRWVVR